MTHHTTRVRSEASRRPRIVCCRQCHERSSPPYRHFCSDECRAAGLADIRARRGATPLPVVPVELPPPAVRQQRRLNTDDIMRAMRGSPSWNT